MSLCPQGATYGVEHPLAHVSKAAGARAPSGLRMAPAAKAQGHARDVYPSCGAHTRLDALALLLKYHGRQCSPGCVQKAGQAVELQFGGLATIKHLAADLGPQDAALQPSGWNGALRKSNVIAS